MLTERKQTRGRIEILASIVTHCKEGIKKTHIMSKANIGYEQLCYYLPTLVETDLVTQVIEEGCVKYRSTETGREFLNLYFGLIKLLNNRKHGSPNQIRISTKLPFGELYEEILNRPSIPEGSGI